MITPFLFKRNADKENACIVLAFVVWIVCLIMEQQQQNTNNKSY
jgi:hypothetical protein